MSQVEVNINEAKVTAVNAFKSRMGDGIDVYIEAKSSYCTIYLQVVLYDDEARKTNSSIREGDYVRAAGMLKEKTYTKKDGTVGYSLIIEKPTLFSKIVSENCSQQVPHQTSSNVVSPSECDELTTDAVPESAITADITGHEESENAMYVPIYASTSKLKKFIIDGQIYEAYDNDDDAEDDLPF